MAKAAQGGGGYSGINVMGGGGGRWSLVHCTQKNTRLEIILLDLAGTLA